MPQYTATDLSLAADLVTQWIEANLQGILNVGGIITTPDMVRASGLTPPPNIAPRAEHDQWSLDWMRVREMVRGRVTFRTNRHPKTAPTVGFRLLEPSEAVQYAEDAAYAAVFKAVRKGAFILHHTQDKDLNLTDKRLKLEAQNRLASLARFAQSQQRARLQQPKTPAALRGITAPPDPLVVAESPNPPDPNKR